MCVHPILGIDDIHRTFNVRVGVLAEKNIPAIHAHLWAQVGHARTQAQLLVWCNKKGSNIKGDGRGRTVPDTFLNVFQGSPNGEPVCQASPKRGLDGKILHLELLPGPRWLLFSSHGHIA